MNRDTIVFTTFKCVNCGIEDSGQCCKYGAIEPICRACYWELRCTQAEAMIQSAIKEFGLLHASEEFIRIRNAR